MVWGSNLSSNVGNPRFTKIVNYMVELPFYIKSVIYGIVISDGFIGFASKTNKNARLCFTQSFVRFPYIWYVFNTLSHYCAITPIPTIGKDNTTQSLQVWTRSLPCFTELHSLWYNEGKKIVPSDIYHYLTPVALGEWICGDGTAYASGLQLCTDSFSNQDVARLINVLIIRYRLDCSMQGYNTGKPRIYIKAKSMPLLREIVTPYIHPSMYYKIHL